MTCEDCINYDWCKDQTNNPDYYDGISYVENKCKGFKSKSQYIKLPCCVGDTVYFLDTKYEKHGRKKVPVEYVDVGFVDNIVLGCLDIPLVVVCNENNIWTTFDGSKDFGKTVFLTKKSAEKALREREEKCK